ncbi:MAG: PA14 domain-containing protein [Deltaproteobacteria bacterium]|nr:PA14 domain-containing protein [Deltaproteobacteria bacterium]
MILRLNFSYAPFVGLIAFAASACHKPPEATSTSAPAVAQQLVRAGLQDVVVFSGLNEPTTMRFAPDGRIFVGEKGGRILVFDDLADATPTVVADLSVKVHNFWDRGLLGLAVDPAFPARPYIYVLYTFDGALGATAPRWGDTCPNPPGATVNGCIVSGHLSRLTISGNVMVGDEVVLVEDWPQQFPSHSVGSLEFGADGALYATAGDGASFNFTDYGQSGDPPNPFGEPPGAVGTPLSAPTAAGGALRSQSPRRGGPVVLNGSVLRVDPDTGAASPGNPRYGDADANLARVVAYGLRNPFRMTVRPGTNELWIGDVGANDWEEINRVVDPTAGLTNFGWPCYEGAGKNNGFSSANLNLCNSLYAEGSATAPYYPYAHNSVVAPADGCGSGSSSVSGVAFYGAGSYPPDLHGALFFSDYSRRCIWAMRAGANGVPDPTSITPIVSAASSPVELRAGPNGDLFYVDLTGKIHRLRYLAPTALGTASPNQGPAPLAVTFDGSASTPGQPGEALTYAWDLDGDGLFNDATGPQASFTYTTPGTYNARLRVIDERGAAAESQPIVVQAGVTNEPPTVVIDAPASTLVWSVGETVVFAGHAIDAEDGALPPSALRWQFRMLHCPQLCHVHPVQTWDGVDSGTLTAPDHEYPSFMELVLTATDSSGATTSTSVRLDPRTVNLTLAANEPGLTLSLSGKSGVAPVNATVIVGSTQTISAPSPQSVAGSYHRFANWSDGLAASHNIVAPATATTYTATYARLGPAGTGLTGEYFSDMTLTSLQLTRLDSQVDFDWGAGAPAAQLPNDRFSARWTGAVRAPITGPVTFHVTSDDGQRLWVGGQLIIDDWVDHGPTERTATVNLTQDQIYDIKYEFYERGGGAAARLHWSGPGLARQAIPAASLFPPNTAVEGTGLRGEYFDDQDLAESKLVRVDSSVDFQWSNGSPDPTLGADTFSVRWTGKVRAPSTEAFTFYTISDDGIRLLINGVPLIDQWNDHAPTEHSGTINLVAGQTYDVVLEFFEAYGGATARLFWSTPTRAREIIPTALLYPTEPPVVPPGTGTGLRGEYFDGTAFDVSTLVRTDATVSFDWGQGSPEPSLAPDTFSVRWTGFVEAPNTETLTFYTRSDDGVRLRVGDQTLIDNWTLHAPTENVGSLSVVAGQKYPIVLEYFENYGGAVARLQWSSASMTKRDVPMSRLYPP